MPNYIHSKTHDAVQEMSLCIILVGVSHGSVQFAVYEPAKRMYNRTLTYTHSGDDSNSLLQYQGKFHVPKYG